MILLLQLLGVAVPAILGFVLLLMVLAVILGGLIHARRFSISFWHPAFAAILLSLALWQATVYGWIG